MLYIVYYTMMDEHISLPFKVGQLAESRSFVSGYRGAWFRCRIKEISRNKGQIRHALEFTDFPGEKIRWTKLYQKARISKSNLYKKKMQRMVRPAYPEATVVNDTWKVGDLVDSFMDGCFWSGRIIEVSAEGKVKIQSPPPPMGEGLCYDASSKDLRPSLDWSPEVGWTVPTPMEPVDCSLRPQLLQPANQESLPNSVDHPANEVKADVQGEPGSLTEFNASLSSQASPHSLLNPDKSEHSLAKDLLEQPLGSTSSKEETRIPETTLDLSGTNDGIRDASDGATGTNNRDSDQCCTSGLSKKLGTDKGISLKSLHPDSREETHIPETNIGLDVANSCIQDVSDGAAGTKGDDEQYCNSRSSKKMRMEKSVSLNSLRSGSLEGSIMELEELVNKVKWLKRILAGGNPNAPPSWKFLEHRASDVQK